MAKSLKADKETPCMLSVEPVDRYDLDHVSA